MGTVLLRNINPLGHVDLPLVGRQEGDDRATLGTEGVGCLDYQASQAGRALGIHVVLVRVLDGSFKQSPQHPHLLALGGEGLRRFPHGEQRGARH